MCTFIAAIRRLPGGAFAKVPKSQGMWAVPVQTTLTNLCTYFAHWPKRKSVYILYGARRANGSTPYVPMVQSLPHLGGAQDVAAKQTHSWLHNGSGGAAGADERLYGPAPVAEAAAAGAAAEAAAAAAAKPLGLAGLLRRFRRGEKLAMVTAYDFPSARFARGAGIDMILVGDSLGNCRLGLPDTVGVTMEDMLRATVSARRGIDAPLAPSCYAKAGPKPLLVGDMPFGSYLLEADALKNAAAFRLAGADVVKLEGGRHLAPFVRSLTTAGIPIMGHIGLQPQSASLQGGLKMQGTTADAAMELVRDAKELAAAGAVAIVVECVPIEVGSAVQAAVPHVPVIGIGAGGEVAGQVLVCDDLLGVHGRPPSFVRMYADLGKAASAAYAAFVADVRSGAFPSDEHARRMKAEELSKLRTLMPAEWWEAKMAKQPQAADAVQVKDIVKDEPLGPVSISTAALPIAPNGSLKVHLFNGSTPKTPTATASPSFLEFAAGRFVQLPRPAGAVRARAISQVAAEQSKMRRDLTILKTRQEVHSWRKEAQRVALVPTMGNLHEGHLELVDEARRHADDVLVSIFVNPAQFAAHEDLDRYPRTFERDVELLRERGARAIFAPVPSEMYPSGSPGGTVVVPRFVQGLSEDACRPHFFTGVATVCLKLFNLSQPDVVVFGQKDAMQCAVIARMLEDLFLTPRISLVVAPTSREADGLARSSRNSYLTPKMRQQAPSIYAALDSATRAAGATPGSVRRSVTEQLVRQGMTVSYVSVADPLGMGEKGDNDPIANSVVSIACLLKDGDRECRLIDNVVVSA